MNADDAAETLCARLCHDLAGLAGTVVGTIEMAAEGDGEALEIGLATARLLSLRLRLYRAAWGGPSEPLTAAAIGELCPALAGAERLRFDLARVAPEPPPVTGRAVLNLLILGAASLPLGGVLTVSADAAGAGLRLAGPRVSQPEHPAADFLRALGRVRRTEAGVEWSPAG